MLSDADKQRARRHLGYMGTVVASSFALGIPQVTDVQWIFESAICHIRPDAEADVVAYLDKLDEIECRLFQSSAELFASKAGDLEPNLQQPDMVEKEYGRWAFRLGEILGVVPYPFSRRFQQMMGVGRAGNIKVVR